MKNTQNIFLYSNIFSLLSLICPMGFNLRVAFYTINWCCITISTVILAVPQNVKCISINIHYVNHIACTLDIVFINYILVRK